MPPHFIVPLLFDDAHFSSPKAQHPQGNWGKTTLSSKSSELSSNLNWGNVDFWTLIIPYSKPPSKLHLRFHIHWTPLVFLRVVNKVTIFWLFDRQRYPLPVFIMNGLPAGRRFVINFKRFSQILPTFIRYENTKVKRSLDRRQVATCRVILKMQFTKYFAK